MMFDWAMNQRDWWGYKSDRGGETELDCGLRKAKSRTYIMTLGPGGGSFKVVKNPNEY